MGGGGHCGDRTALGELPQEFESTDIHPPMAITQ